MIDNDTEYLAMKKQCNDGLYQFSQPSGYDKSKWKYAPDTVNCPHWIFSEEYALTQKDFHLSWHTPYAIDGGISFNAKLHGDTLEMKTIQDGIVELGVIDRKSLKLERFRNRMISIQVDAKVKYEEGKFDDGPGKIHVFFLRRPRVHPVAGAVFRLHRKRREVYRCQGKVEERGEGNRMERIMLP